MDKFNWAKSAYALFLLCAATAIALPAQTFRTVYNFEGTDGANPLAGLVLATDGNLYGTTSIGRTSSNCTGGCGTVFKITRSGTLTTLHSFDFADGALPYGGLVHATHGDFYGTTWGGGTSRNCPPNGCGTVFSLSPIRP